MRRRIRARYDIGPLTVARFSDVPGWHVAKADSAGRLRPYYPAPFSTLPQTLRTLEQDQETILAVPLPRLRP